MPEAISAPAADAVITPPPNPAPQLSPGQKLVAAAPLPPETPPSDTQPPAQPQQPTLSPRAQKLAELGFENVTNDDEAFDRLVAAYSQTKNEFGAQIQAALAELKQTPAQPTVTPPTQDAKTGKWTWAPPAVDPTLLSLYRTADGWKPETPAEIRQAADARQRYLDSFAQKFVSDPAATLDPLLEDKFSEFFERKYGELSKQQQFQTTQQKLFADNPWLFEADPVSGKPNTNALSAEGKLIDQYMADALGRGADYEFAWDYAVNKHRASKAEFAGKQTTQAQTVQQINDQKKAEMLSRASNATPNRGGSLPAPAAPNQTQNRHLSFGERFKLNAERNGVPLNPVA